MNLTAIRQKVKRDAILDDITQNRFNLFFTRPRCTQCFVRAFDTPDSR